jgi:site-specific DNA-methyltransferase (adenine-specific)
MENFQEVPDTYASICGRCGALRCELGREPTPQLYIKHLCDIFESLKPALADWGSLYVNLGDTYFGGGQGEGTRINAGRDSPAIPNARNILFPSKSLALIPYIFAYEMVYNRGWILRNVINWHKPNPMPTSAMDRFTVDFEPLFFFTKQRYYYYRQYLEVANDQSPSENILYGGTKYPDSGTSSSTYSGKPYVPFNDAEGVVYRNLRTTWDINTSASKDKHFAQYPEKLCQFPIYCSCPAKICTKCGEPVTYERIKRTVSTRNPSEDMKTAQNQYATSPKHYIPIDYGIQEVRCSCYAPFVSGVVLDPFFGTGTTALVALKQHKQFIGFDIKQEYANLADEKIRRTFPNYDKEDDTFDF